MRIEQSKYAGFSIVHLVLSNLRDIRGLLQFAPASVFTDNHLVPTARYVVALVFDLYL